MPTIALESFSPAEAESICGCSQAVQRDYRARGLLPSNGGKRARFDVFDLALILFVRSMNDRDLGFVAARTLGPWAVDSIVRRALLHADAFDLAALSDDDMHLDELAARVLEVHSPSGPERAGYDAGRFVVIWADDAPGFYNTVNPELFEAEAAQRPQRTAGPVLVFDTLTVAAELLKRAERPLVRVGGGTPALSFAPRALVG